MHNKPYFKNLDSMRFMSFMAVFLFHAHLNETVANRGYNRVVRGLVGIVASGGWGVTFFFVLSGFLITWLLLCEKRETGGIDIRAFYLRRALRIWPVYYLVMLTGFVIVPGAYRLLGRPVYLPEPIAAYLLFFSNYAVLWISLTGPVRTVGMLVDISWSVAIEEQFYLIWPLLQSGRRIARFAGPIAIVVSLASACVSRNGEELYFSTLVRFGELGIGCSLAQACFSFPRILERVRDWTKPFLVALYAAVALVVLISGLNLSPLTEYVLRMVGSFLFGLTILEQNFCERSLLKFGTIPLFSRGGKISYGLYMYHPIGLMIAAIALKRVYHASAPVETGYAFAAVSLVISLAIASMSYARLEKPFLRLKGKLSRIG